MYIIKPLAILMAASFVFVSCDKEEPEVEEETYEVTISIVEPTEGQVLTSGDEMHLEAIYESEGTIHQIGVYVIGETLGDTLYQYETHAHTDNYYEFHEHTDVMVASSQEYKVIFRTWDMSGAAPIEEHVHVTINP